MPGNKPKVGEIWMIEGANCQDLVLVTGQGEGVSLDCENSPGCNGVMWFSQCNLSRRIQEAEK
jgi:hypothetical protein